MMCSNITVRNIIYIIDDVMGYRLTVNEKGCDDDYDDDLTRDDFFMDRDEPFERTMSRVESRTNQNSQIIFEKEEGINLKSFFVTV
jgi:hypothetical protein